MKNLILNKYICIPAILSMACIFSGCENKIDDFGKNTGSDAANEVYIEAKDRTANYVITQTVNDGTQGADTLLVKFPVHSTLPVTGTTKVKVILDNSLIDVYNAKNETDYYPFSNDDLELKQGTLTIAEGQTISKDSVSIAYKESLSTLSGLNGQVGKKNYLIPLRILTSSGLDTKIKYDERICYVTVNVTQENGILFKNTALRNMSFANIPAVNDIFDLNTISFSVSTQYYALDATANITLEVDNSLIAAYNAEYGTNYLAVPGGFNPVQVKMTQGTSTFSGLLSYADESKNLPAGSYLIPIKISQADNVQIVDEQKVFYTALNLNIAAAGNVTTTLLTSATEISDPGFGTSQADRSKYVARYLNAITGAEVNVSGPANIFGTGATSLTSSVPAAMDIVIDLGREVENITGWSLASNNATSMITEYYDICYATEAMFNNKQEIFAGSLNNCLQFVYASFNTPVTARYIMLRNAKRKSNYFAWKSFYIYTIN
ncbi:MAG: DUF1735 domain-containing protein [Prevotella sp.]|jgi:hypothetical protein|nr:DUF1735 domain-containing protein [Prevotella sp.]